MSIHITLKKTFLECPPKIYRLIFRAFKCKKLLTPSPLLPFKTLTLKKIVIMVIIKLGKKCTHLPQD